MWLTAAAAGTGRLFFVAPVDHAACSALSFFNFFLDTKALGAESDYMFKEQTDFQRTLESVRTRCDDLSFLLRNKVMDT